MNEVRAIVALVGFFLFFGLGFVFPYRKNPKSVFARGINNILLTLFNSSLIHFVAGAFLFELSLQAQSNQWGLFAYTSFLIPVDIVLGLVIQDFVIYWQHRLFHLVPLFWRLHRVHHADTLFDTTTALRFHTLEIFLSLCLKALVVIVFGLPPVSVIGFEIILNFSAMFNHGNFSLGRIDRFIRYFLVTPDMHRVHHTTVNSEMNSNFGFCLSIWDRIFKSYRRDPDDIKTKDLGLKDFRSHRDQHIDQLLIQPFLSKN